MKKIIFLILAISLFGCKDFLNVNISPNEPGEKEATEQFLFPAAVENTASVIGTYVVFLGNIWAQYWTSAPQAPSFQQEDSYQVTAGEYDYDLGTWRNIYSNALMDYELTKKIAMEKQNWTYYLMATVMQCYTYHILADLWDRIPLSEALKSVPPKFDMGPQIYDTLIARLDFALSKDLTLATCKKPGDDDLVFKGDMNKWKEFANTLKLKIYMRQIYAKPDVLNNIQSLIQSGVSFISDDVKYTHFKDEQYKDNYTYAREWRSGNINIRASKTIIDYLVKKNDKRYEYLFLPVSGTYKGMYQGDFRNVYSYPNDSKVEVSKIRITPTMPIYFMTKSEALFLLSEAYLRLNNFNLAKQRYKDAISAHISRLNTDFNASLLNLSTIDTTVIFSDNSGYARFLNTMTDEQLLELIITQKWIALANIGGHEAFFEHNRTKYPREYGKIDQEFIDNYNNYLGYWLVSCTGVLPETSPYPRRLIYPSIEQNKNPNVPPLKQVYEPVWWDVRTRPY